MNKYWWKKTTKSNQKFYHIYQSLTDYLPIFWVNLSVKNAVHVFHCKSIYIFKISSYFPSGLNFTAFTLRAKLNLCMIVLLLVLHNRHSPSSFTNRISHPSGEISTVVILKLLSTGNVSDLLLLILLKKQ